MAEDNPEASERFLRAAGEIFLKIAGLPGLGSPRHFKNPSLQGLRMFPIPGFEKHLVFYLAVEGGIRIIRILHSSRDIRALFEV
ncbi:MAG: type II toxin-antitoxin system RelE/ParE family toxin [Planctomycetes bacterium]|nr:type II toxin-antitoxin system RelE/ParE family toxin [Planctomycetota bacterium]